MPRVTLSGPNNQRSTRTVYLDGVEIGSVVPITTTDHEHWEARDLKGRCHGDRWLSDWYAADALSRSYMLPVASVTLIFCRECQDFKPIYEHYDNDGKLVKFHMRTRNSARTWEHELCHDCWLAFTAKTFCSVTREGDRVVATAAF